MDWVWRICLAFAAMWVVRETDIGIVADMRTENGLIINSVVQALLATLGALPLAFKMFPSLFPGNQKTSSQKNTSKDSQRSISNIGHKTSPIENEGKMHENNNPVSAAQQRKEDEKLYELVAAELSKDQKNEGLWLKAMAATE